MKELKEIKKLVRLFKNTDYKVLFMALCVNEKLDYLDELEDLNGSDLERLEEIYNKYMENDGITGLLNADLMDELFKEVE